MDITIELELDLSVGGGVTSLVDWQVNTEWKYWLKPSEIFSSLSNVWESRNIMFEIERDPVRFDMYF